MAKVPDLLFVAVRIYTVVSSCFVLPAGLGAKGKRRPSVHFAGQDRVYDGIRYLQQPMGYPSDGHREEKPLRLWPKKFENEANFLERMRIFAVHIRCQPVEFFFRIQYLIAPKEKLPSKPTVQSLFDL